MTNDTVEVMQAVPDYAGHLAHAIRDTCFARLRKIVSFDDSYHMAADISARLAAISADQVLGGDEPWRIAIWNACRGRGMGQDAIVTIIADVAAALTPPAPAANPFAPADDAEACTCQRFPSHQANDCPHHGLEPPFDATSPAPEAPTIPKGMKPWMSGNALVPAAARARIEGMLERLEDIRDERHFPAHMMSVHDEMVEMLEELAGDLAQEARTDEVRELREALELIGSASDTTLMCDPLGSKRIALAALRKSTGGEG